MSMVRTRELQTGRVLEGSRGVTDDIRLLWLRGNCRCCLWCLVEAVHIGQTAFVVASPAIVLRILCF